MFILEQGPGSTAISISRTAVDQGPSIGVGGKLLNVAIEFTHEIEL